MDSVNRESDCGAIDAWEEDMWLDRRERACRPSPARHGLIRSLGAWLHRACTRMQLGPTCGGWPGGDPDKPF